METAEDLTASTWWTSDITVGGDLDRFRRKAPIETTASFAVTRQAAQPPSANVVELLAVLLAQFNPQFSLVNALLRLMGASASSRVRSHQFVLAAPKLSEEALSGAQVASPAWLSEFYELAARGETDDAMDLAFDSIDRLLSDRRFEDCQDILDQLEVERLDSELLVSLLAITRPASGKIPRRSEFTERVATRLRRLIPERAEGLIEKLR